MAKGNIILNGTIIMPLDQQAKLRPLLEEHTALTRAEPGCLFFEVTQDQADPARFTVSERFADQAALAFHEMRGAASAWGPAARHLQREFVRRVE